MSRHEFTGLARFPLAILDFAEELGLDRAELMLVANLGEEDLHDPDARVPMRVVWSLWEEVIRRAPDRPLGMMFGRDASARELGLVGYTMYHSDSLQRAIERLIRYSHILADAIQFRLVAAERTVQIVLDNEPEARALRHPVDSRLAAILAVSREITSTEIVPVEVCFCYPEPSATAAHREFFRAPLSFGQPDSMLVLRERDLKLPVKSADETLSGYLDQLADELLQSATPRGSFVERVQRAVWSKLSGGQPTLRRMAQVLGVSVRTLQRRLGEEGTTFAAVLDGLRRHMSVRLLNNRELAVYEVAYLLGYSEPSTFFRAFRRWHGIPPAEYRKLTGKGAAASEESAASGGEVS